MWQGINEGREGKTEETVSHARHQVDAWTETYGTSGIRVGSTSSFLPPPFPLDLLIQCARLCSIPSSPCSLLAPSPSNFWRAPQSAWRQGPGCHLKSLRSAAAISKIHPPFLAPEQITPSLAHA